MSNSVPVQVIHPEGEIAEMYLGEDDKLVGYAGWEKIYPVNVLQEIIQVMIIYSDF